ncbi:tRNA (guanosine(46)-N7)-methyltransferase TrmB [Planctomycetes bacterium K23_9]|uniref:tRNA (guanine-N(7)-)-methyltransferase n=1 Tax=Stieleria marina TaxID=1930275 RepID=A0A517NS74_9BACT|nr:tRNA (guanine-N(7)-)-methyltransferase [Planctomycetes bacterium K23_9]
MPRSTIRRPSPELDLSAHFRMSDDLPAELTSQTLFQNDRPLEIEIGSGKGLFMSTVSQANPLHNFLGIEIATKYARHAAGRLSSGQNTNAMMVAGNAEPLFQKSIPSESLEAVHVYFPDPWWKKRHRKRRVVNEVSVRNYCQAIRSGGRFHFWTDVLDYFEMTIEMIAELVPEFGVPIPEEEIEATHDLDYHTHFERRSRQHHIPVYRVRFEKR